MPRSVHTGCGVWPIVGETGGLQDVDEALALAAMDQRRAALDRFDREAICAATRRAGTNQFAPLAPQFQRGGFPLPVREAGRYKYFAHSSHHRLVEAAGIKPARRAF